MDRANLTRILEACDGVTTKDDVFEVGEMHRLTFYIGKESHAMAITEVARGTNGSHFVTLVSRESGAVFYVEHDTIQGVSMKPPKSSERRKTGFA